MKIKAPLLNTFVWPSFTKDITKHPRSFFSESEKALERQYETRATALMPSMKRASLVAVRMMLSNHQTKRDIIHAAR